MSAKQGSASLLFPDMTAKEICRRAVNLQLGLQSPPGLTCSVPDPLLVPVFKGAVTLACCMQLMRTHTARSPAGACLRSIVAYAQGLLYTDPCRTVAGACHLQE